MNVEVARFFENIGVGIRKNHKTPHSRRTPYDTTHTYRHDPVAHTAPYTTTQTRVSSLAST